MLLFSFFFFAFCNFFFVCFNEYSLDNLNALNFRYHKIKKYNNLCTKHFQRITLVFPLRDLTGVAREKKHEKSIDVDGCALEDVNWQRETLELVW